MTIRSRKVARSRGKLWAKNDIVFCLQIPLLLSVSWVFPEKHWNALCFRYEKLRATFGFASRPVASIVARAACRKEIAEAPVSFNLKHEALRNEHYLQIFRNYRPGGWTPLLTLEGEDHLRTALEKGRGAVLWVAHFCFSPLAAKKALSHAGYKVWHVSRPEHGPVKSRLGIRFLNPICTGIENRFLAGRIVIDREIPNKATMMAARLLRKNQVVSITAGAWEGKKVASVELLGGTFELAIGAPFLASLCGAALLPVFTVRDDSRSAIKVILGEPLVVGKTLDEDLRLAFLAQSFADRMAPYIKNYPDQWLDWRDLSLPGKMGSE